MKNFKSILGSIVLIAAVSILSCKDKKGETKVETKVEAKIETEITTEKQGKEYTSAYVCPMHCADSGSDAEGTCDTCGMTLVKNEDHKANGHSHE